MILCIVFALFIVSPHLSMRAAFGDEKSIQELVSEGNALYLKGDFKGALEAYQAALLLEAKGAVKAKIHYNLGNTYYRLGEFMNAVREYQEALRLNPDDTDSKFNLELALQALRGETGILVGEPSQVEGGLEQNSLDEEIKIILQTLEQEEFRDPKGIPIPPSPEERLKKYKKDW